MTTTDGERTPAPGSAPAPLDFKELQELAGEILGLDPERVQPDVSLARDLAADSLDTVELIMAVEDRYQVSLPDEQLEGMKKVGDLWNFLLANSRRAGV
ncbi:MAG: acyl carrier protein [Candidatus Dormibacteria bacterium]